MLASLSWLTDHGWAGPQERRPNPNRPRALAASPGAQVTIDLPAQTVRFPDGSLVPFDVDAFRKACLLEGVDEIDLTLKHEGAITAWEARRGAQMPWLARRPD